MIDYTILQGMFNEQMFTLLQQDGFTTECLLTYVETLKNLCPNCLFDVDLNIPINYFVTNDHNERNALIHQLKYLHKNDVVIGDR